MDRLGWALDLMDVRFRLACTMRRYGLRRAAYGSRIFLRRGWRVRTRLRPNPWDDADPEALDYEGLGDLYREYIALRRRMAQREA